MTVEMSVPASGQRTPQCALEDDGQRRRIHLALADSQFLQKAAEKVLALETPRQMVFEQVDRFARQFAFSHVVQSRLVDDILALFAGQQLQEVEASFRVATGKVGELIIADDGTVAVLALMAGTGIIHMEPFGAVDAGGPAPHRLLPPVLACRL